MRTFARTLAVAALALFIAGGGAGYRGADNKLVLGYTDSEGRHYPKGPPVGTVYHYPDSEVSNQLTRSNVILPATYSSRFPSAGPWRHRTPHHEKPGHPGSRSRSRKHQHHQTPAPPQQGTDVYRTSQWGSVRIPYRGASVNVPAQENSRKTYRGSVTTTVYTPQHVLTPRKGHQRQGDRHLDTGLSTMDTVQDAPSPSARSTGPCVRCPGDRAVVASRGRDMVLVEQPELMACAHNPRFKLADLRVEWIHGPKPGTLATEGSHIMVGMVMFRHRQLQICQLKYNVIVRKCPPLILPKHTIAQCSDGNIWGSECQLFCQHGYQLRGHNTTECVETLSWTHPMPYCEVTSGCPMPMSPEHGRLSCKTSSKGEGNLLPENSICRYECDQGYAIPQSQMTLTVISCSFGEWNSTADPSCQDISGKKVDKPEVVLKDAKHQMPRRRHRDHRLRSVHRTIIDPCHTNPCKDGGTCLRGPRSTNIICLCQDDREGEFCERARCREELCENGGKCMVFGQQTMCYCPAGYSGVHCQIQDPR